MKNIILPGLIFFLALAGCAFAKENDEYVLILKSRGNSYWTTVVNGVNETAKAHQVTALVYQLENDVAAEEQLNVCMAVIARKPRLITISAVTASVGLQCMKKAAEAGILVADMDRNISVADAKAKDINLAYSVGSDNFLIGETAAQYARKIIKTSRPKILVLEGSAGSVPGQKRADGFRSNFKELLPLADIVSISGDWDRLKAMNIVSDLMQREADLDVIYAAYDLMALGAAEAVRNAKKSTRVKIIGVDGTADARKAILEGRMTASVAQLPYLIGKRSVEMGLEAVQIQRNGVVEITPTPILTADVLKAGKDPLLQYVR